MTADRTIGSVATTASMRALQAHDTSMTASGVPVQLQNAARELQAAIQSVRQRRQSSEMLARPRLDAEPPSMNRSDTLSDGGYGDKENASDLTNYSVAERVEALCKGIDAATTHGLDEGSEDAKEDESDGEDALALSHLSGLSALSALDSDDSDAWSVGDQGAGQQQKSVADHGSLTCESLEAGAGKALRWMQEDVERQARANKAASERLARAVSDITDAIADAVPGAVPLLSSVRATVDAERLLGLDHVAQAATQWKLAVDEWKLELATEKQALALRFSTFRDDCESRLQALEATHQAECERLQGLVKHEREAASLRDRFNGDERDRMCGLIDDMKTKMERLQCRNEDLAAHLLRQTARSAVEVSLPPASIPQSQLDHPLPSRDLLDLVAKSKEADLRALQWQMALQEQADASRRTESRLQMLLEDQRVRNEMTMEKIDRMVPRQSLDVYQQRISWLEAHVSDMQRQIACDHEQFGYEVAKWELEKQGAQSELEEIRDVSVRLLKMLLTREKLMKKRERKHASRLESARRNLEASKGKLKGLVQRLMQESAALLLVLQQLVAQAVAVPAKPADVRAMVKHLKRLDRALDKVEVASTVDGAAEEATESFSVDSTISEASFDVGAAETLCGERT